MLHVFSSEEVCEGPAMFTDVARLDGQTRTLFVQSVLMVDQQKNGFLS